MKALISAAIVAQPDPFTRLGSHQIGATAPPPSLRKDLIASSTGRFLDDFPNLHEILSTFLNVPRANRAKHRFPFAERHQARWNVNGATGTERFRHREKVAEYPRQPPVTGRLWSLLTGNCPQNSGTIRDCGENISDIRDWLAERERYKPSVPVHLCFALTGPELARFSVGIYRRLSREDVRLGFGRA